MPRLIPCSWSPAPARVEQQEGVDHLGDGDLVLPDADGLDDDDVEALRPPGRASTRGSRAPLRRGGFPLGDGRTKASSLAVSSAIRVRSPRIEPPVRREGRVDGDDTDPMPALDQPGAHRVDEGRLSRPGTPVIPTRTEPPVCGVSAVISSRARSR
jgi:hypothetical protein